MNVAVLDLETTGVNPANDFIVEIGIVLLNLETGFMTKIYHALVREEGLSHDQMNAWIFNNSDLEFVDVWVAKDLDKKAVQHIMDLYPVTAYNSDFDFAFLESRGIKIHNKMKCPMKALTEIIRIPHHHFGYKYPSVTEAHKYFFPNEPYEETHRALQDAFDEARIIRQIHKEYPEVIL